MSQSYEKTAQREERMNELLQEGKILDAFEEFTSNDVVMIDGGQEPRKGKKKNREYENQFAGSVEDIHEMALQNWGVSDDGRQSYSEWTFDISFQGGDRQSWRQIERRQWNEDGKVEHVQFFKDAD